MVKSKLSFASISLVCKRHFNIYTANFARKSPKEEYDNTATGTRKKTAEPFDRRWKWTAKSAEPFNIRGGDIEWTKMPMLHRGVQRPGYFDPKTKKFIFVPEMVPDIVVPDLNGFDLKPYVTYSFEKSVPPLDAKKLFEETFEKDILIKVSDKIKAIKE